MTVAIAETEALNIVDAQLITSRIREWVKAFPAEDVKRAYLGRVWISLGYESWSEWCDSELGGFKLPAIERREVVAELSDAGMSNPAIADVIGVDQSTVYRDKQGAGFANANPVVGQDGKTYHRPAPKPKEPNRNDPVLDDAEYLNILQLALSTKELRRRSPSARTWLIEYLKKTIRELEEM